jgi:hypothetical protein
LRRLVIAAAGLCLLATLARPATAFAQSGLRFIVEPFVGAGALRFREMTTAALVNLEHQVLPDRDVSGAISQLRLVQLSDDRVALARRLGATSFIEGAVFNKKSKAFAARLKIRNASGVVTGYANWSASTLEDVLVKARMGLKTELQRILSGRPSLAGGNGEDIADFTPTVDVSLSARSDAGRGSGPSLSWLDIAVGTQIYSRAFAYSQNTDGMLEDYSLAGIPAANLAVEYFPLRFLGLAASGEYAISIGSRRTTAFGYSVGAKLRTTLRHAELSLNGTFAENAFWLDRGNAADAPRTSDVSYRELKPGASIRLPLARSVVVVGGANYLHLLAVGELQSAEYFPQLSGYGGEGYAGLAVPVSSAFEVRALATIRRYVFQMTPVEGLPRQAAGATDQYLGVNLGIAYRD